MSHYTEDWCKVWRKTNFLFQRWQKFGEFWSEHLKVRKTCTLIGPFCAKYITFDLKKYRGVIFHDTRMWCKIWIKTDLWFGKWHEEFSKFSPEHMEVSKLGLSLGLFIKSTKRMSLKLTGELRVMTMKNDTKFEKELTCQFKTDMRNNKFWPKHSKISKICTLMSCFWPKYIIFELRKYRGVMFGDTQDLYKIWRKTDLYFLEWHEEFGKFSSEHLKVSKMGSWWHPFV